MSERCDAERSHQTWKLFCFADECGLKYSTTETFVPNIKPKGCSYFPNWVVKKTEEIKIFANKADMVKIGPLLSSYVQVNLMWLKLMTVLHMKIKGISSRVLCTI